MTTKIKYFTEIVNGCVSLLTGMKLTLGYFLNPKTVVTRQYPENRKTLVLSPRFRGQVYMPHDENNEHNCTACTKCELACPNGSISILPTKNLAGKKVLGKFIYRLSQCTLCNLCIESCPFAAIEMNQDFEFSTSEKQDIDLILNRKEGRS